MVAQKIILYLKKKITVLGKECHSMMLSIIGSFVLNLKDFFKSVVKLNSWRATALQSLAPNRTCLEVSSNPEDLG